MKPETLGIAQLNSLLKQAELDLDAQQIADILWLAAQISEIEEISLNETPVESTFGAGLQDTSSNFLDNINLIPVKDPQTVIDTETKTPSDAQLTPPIKSASSPPAAYAYLPNSPENQLPKKISKKTVSESIPFQSPAAPALRQPLALARALRPLMRKVPSPTQTVIDEEETVTQITEKGIWTPVLKPAPERWLELALVVEESRSTVIWQEVIAEFQRLTELQGAFRDVRTWSLKIDHNGVIKLFPKGNFSVNKQGSRSFKELLDPTGRRLIVLISDCISPIWRQGKINQTYQFLKAWSNNGPVAILQLLPERIWERTALGDGFPIQLSALIPGVANSPLVVDGLPVWKEVNPAKSLTLPVITLEPDSLKQWSRVVAGVGNIQTAGILWDLSLLTSASATTQEQLSAADLVTRFRKTASLTAKRLSKLMAAVPVSLPVIYLIQKTLLPESRQAHIAEVFMSGLLQPQSDVEDVGVKYLVRYEFVEGVRDLLLDSVPIPDVEAALETVSQYIAHRAGLSIKNFTALLSPDTKWDKATAREVMPFAQIATQVLRRLGGEHAAIAELLEHSTQVVRQSSDAESDVPQTGTKIASEIELEPFDFTVATIELKAIGLIVKRYPQKAYRFTEDLGNGVALEMVAIPEGSFLMGSGSRKDEPERRKSESPQHRVTVKSFLMGKYPVTQVQWRAVAALPPVSTKLKPNPSHFPGYNLPVERVSWSDAVEFCARLSRKTGRHYRLPSEAEWEYACRAGTTTPFHFGKTITPELANYNGNYTYGSSVQGKERQKTTPVGSFGVANDFGLYDMHGNVWEWCADYWHNDYEGAPIDGSPWKDSKRIKKRSRLLRGGSWRNSPGICRSACRSDCSLGASRHIVIGFRVVCEAVWTL